MPAEGHAPSRPPIRQPAARSAQGDGFDRQGDTSCGQGDALWAQGDTFSAQGDGFRPFCPRTLSQVSTPRSAGSAVTDSALPIRAVLPDLLDALNAGSSAVLVAPPGAGKTTAMA